MDTPGRAAFLCTSTADFHPPDWACAPIEANSHARLEAFRESRHCATYMVATQRVNLFGRDQEACDHVLGNPSVSRKHAAVIHDADGGIYMVDLMSRHGTYVGRTKIPPHDPYLLHEGDTIKFGQSVRVYILKGASPDGKSAPIKKSWGRKLRPHVSIGAVLPKRSPNKPKASAAVTKMVNAVCYGTLKDEKVATFITGVLELDHDKRKEVADTLVERIQAKYEFYAAHVHRNAFVATMALLKQNLCVEEFEDNLDIITHISQQRNDNIYRADARKLLQAIAAVRLDPENPQFNDADSTEEDVGSACPPTANNREGRERSISDEGKKLFLAGHGMPYPGRSESVGAIDSHRETIGHGMSHYPSSSDYDDADGESESRLMDNGYAPPLALVNGNGVAPYKPPVNSPKAGSGFNFIGQFAPEGAKGNGSAFGFIGGSEPVDEFSSQTSSVDKISGQPSTGFNFVQKHNPPSPPSVAVNDFLLEHLSVEGCEFEDMWESANDESEEWSVDLGSLDAHELEAHELQLFLEPYRMLCLSSDKVAGQQQWRFVAEQKSEGTLFLVEISVMPGLTDMTVALKWIVNSLLYRSGHVTFMEILKFALYQFSLEAQKRPRQQSQQHHVGHMHESTQNHVQHQLQNGRDPDLAAKSHPASLTASHTTSHGDEDDVDDDAGDEDSMSARDYLVQNPVIDASKFEQVWATATEIASLSFTLNEVPEVDEVIDIFSKNCLGCLASGSVDKFVKFFFFAEMTELQCVFCIELAIGVDTGALEGTIKRLAIRQRSDEEEEQIDSSFVSFFEEVLQEL